VNAVRTRDVGLRADFGGRPGPDRLLAGGGERDHGAGVEGDPLRCGESVATVPAVWPVRQAYRWSDWVTTSPIA